MVDLVEKLPEHEQVLKAPVQMQYAFALNRRNQTGDRDKALGILEKVTYTIDSIVIISYAPVAQADYH